MRNILEVQMLRYSKIMLGNCCNIWSSLLSSIMSCHQWVIRSPDWPKHSFLTTTKLFSPTVPLHTLLPSPSVSHGWLNVRPCPRSHQHWMSSKFHRSVHRSHPRPNQSKWYSMFKLEPNQTVGSVQSLYKSPAHLILPETQISESRWRCSFMRRSPTTFEGTSMLHTKQRSGCLMDFMCTLDAFWPIRLHRWAIVSDSIIICVALSLTLNSQLFVGL